MLADSRRRPDPRDCPAGCGREKRPADLLCRRCWYVAPATLKDEYRSACESLRTYRSRGAIDALKKAKTAILDSVTPHREQ